MEILTIEGMSTISGGDVNWGLIGCLGGLVAAAGALAAFIAAAGGTVLAFFATCNASMLSNIAAGFGCATYLNDVLFEKK